MIIHNTPPEFFRKATMNILAGWQASSWFGYTENLGTTELAISPDPWDIIFPTSALIVQVSSSNAGDTAGGAGARSVHITGLDADYNEIEEVILLNGQTPVLSNNEFLRVNSMHVEAAGSLGKNVGDLWCSHGGATLVSGVPSDDTEKLSIIAAGDNQSNCAWATVPNNYFVHITAGLWTVGASKTCRISFLSREYEHTIYFRKRGEIELNGAGVNFEFYRTFPPKTDIKVTGKADLASTSVSAYYNYILERVSNGE